jgi:hypothetical protein
MFGASFGAIKAIDSFFADGSSNWELLLICGIGYSLGKCIEAAILLRIHYERHSE